jgi:hypothetical protein
VANQRPRSRITGARLTIPEVAAQVGVDPRRLSDGSSWGAFPTARIAGQPRRCWGPTRLICGPSSPTSDAPRRPAPPSWSPSTQPRRRPTSAVAQPPGGHERPHRRAGLCRAVPARRLSRDRQAACVQGRAGDQGAPSETPTLMRCGGGARRNASAMAWPPGPAGPAVPAGCDRRSRGRASLPRHHALQLDLPVR